MTHWRDDEQLRGRLHPEYPDDLQVVIRRQSAPVDELFDAPSELAAGFAAQAPEGGTVEMFTQFCPLCGGVQTVCSREAVEHWDVE